MKEFNDYDIEYPELIIDILEYFWLDADRSKKSVKEFCFNNKYNLSLPDLTISPKIVVNICEILYNNNVLSVDHRGGVDGMNNNYSFICHDKEYWERNRPKIIHQYNSLVYGFEYIYRSYQDKVIPIIAYKEDGSPMMGTAFKFHNGLVTARHCVTDGETIAIRGYGGLKLNSLKVYVSKNPDIDVAYIDTSEPAGLFSDSPKTLDDILVMGFPNIPRFLDFCTAERATISTIADLRMTPTRGSVAALADEMGTYNDTKLILITAKIKGGNSGGPIINKEGSVIGVAFGESMSEGSAYDDLGYGIATPISIIDNIIKDNNLQTVNFVDFNE